MDADLRHVLGQVWWPREWIYVRPEARGSGIATVLIAAMCADAFNYGFSPDDEDIAQLYRRVAIVRGLPDPSLNHEA